MYSATKDGVVVDVVDGKQVVYEFCAGLLADSNIWYHERTEHAREMSVRCAVRRLFAVI